MNEIPVIDVSPLLSRGSNVQAVADRIGAACRDCGFFYMIDHGVPEALIARLDELSRQFFSLSLPQKRRIRMELAGRAWRGYFAVGEELTSGKPDQKEGIYFGTELDEQHPMVAAATPLHGANLFPDIEGFRETVLEFMDRMTGLGHALMSGIASSLGLEHDYFQADLTHDPIVLFRIFHYPPLPLAASGEAWSVGEHTDYGLLTMLAQDESGGLQIRSKGEWIDAPPIPGSFVCNIGDMLDLMTGGRYRSTPHRVRNLSREGRCSFPFFFDPGWDAHVRAILPPSSSEARWDGADLKQLSGSYGDYLMNKVSKVFPDLSNDDVSGGKWTP